MADLNELSQRLAAAAGMLGPVRRSRLDTIARQLHAIGPSSVLQRGYSYTLRDDGQLITSPAQVRGGDRLRTRVASGEIHSRVEPANAQTSTGEAHAPPPASAHPAPLTPKPRLRHPPPSTSADADPKEQLDLFAADR